MALTPPLSQSGAGWIASVALAVFPAMNPALAQNAPSAAQKPARVAMRDSVTEQALKQQVSAASGMDAQMASKTKPLPDVRPSTKSSLLENSIVLFDGAMCTLVPVGSVLNLPPSLRNRVVEKPQGNFTYWPSFLKRNASWLSVREVPLKMAKGDAKAGEAIMREVVTDSRLVVAVYKGGPISILEPVAEPKGREKTPSVSATAESQKQPR